MRTGHGADCLVKQGIDVGAVVIITKPVNLAHFPRTLAAAA